MENLCSHSCPRMSFLSFFFLQESPITKHLQVYRQHLKYAPLTSGSKKFVFANKLDVNCPTSI